MPEADISQLESLIKDLASIQDQLLALDDDDHQRRAELHQEQNELRKRVAELRVDLDAGRSRAELEAELAAWRERLDALRGQRIDPVVQAGGGDAGWGNIGAVKINHDMMQAQGADEIKARIAHLEQRLRDAS
jgi:multidrug efflux pump subunit AcrA (membrane-fusion protein)